MRAVVQRVTSGSVQVGDAVVGSIELGLVVLVGIEAPDTDADLAWMADKIVHLRIFVDPQGKMNLSVLEVRGGVLLVPNFTVAGDAAKGRRPSFDNAMRPETAEPLFRALASRVAELGAIVATGVFRAMMRVSIVNDGPVTMVLRSPRRAL